MTEYPKFGRHRSWFSLFLGELERYQMDIIDAGRVLNHNSIVIFYDDDWARAGRAYLDDTMVWCVWNFDDGRRYRCLAEEACMLMNGDIDLVEAC